MEAITRMIEGLDPSSRTQMTECKYNGCSYAMHYCMTLCQLLSPTIRQQAMDTESGGLGTML